MSTLKHSTRKYASVNALRAFIGAICVFLSIYLANTGILLFSSLYLLLSVVWFSLSLASLIDEEGYFAYLTTALDLSLGTFFVYLTGTFSSPFTFGLLFITAISSLNMKVNQGLFSLIYGSIIYTVLAVFVSMEWIPHFHAFGPSSNTNKIGLVVSISLFVAANISLYLFIRNLGKSNLDLISQKEMEKQKAETAYLEAEASNQAKRYFLANMSHEIRTPMNGIIGLASLLQRTELNEEQNDFLESIVVSANNLVSIINDILDFSKIEANKLELVPENINLESFLLEINNLLLYRIREKNITWKINFDPSLPKWIFADSIRLKQILINLIGNAIKFTPSAGRIELSVHLEEKKEDLCFIRFEISDTGIGIDTEKFKLLFLPFEQADNMTTRKFGGSGLGLAISQSLVKMMGGNITVQSELGKGSIFGFSVSIKAIEQAEIDAITNVQISIPKRKILLRRDLRLLSVDDNEINQKVMFKISKILNMNLDYARDGREAVLAHYQSPYDIIFMDMQMPVMDGLEATRRIRTIEKRSLKSALIVAMTANAFEEDKEKCFQAGMNDFLAKPIKADAIIDLIARYAEIAEPGSQ